MECIIPVTIGSLSSDVFERRTSTGSGRFALLSRDFEQIFGQIVSIRIKTLGNINVVASRLTKREKGSLPVDVCRSKTSLLKLPITAQFRAEKRSAQASVHPLSQAQGGLFCVLTAFRCVCLLLEFLVKCTRCERLLHLEVCKAFLFVFLLLSLLFFHHLKITLDSEQPNGSFRQSEVE